MNAAIGYLGPEGSNSHAAAQRMLTHGLLPAHTALDLLAYPSFYALMDAVADGVCAWGLLPVENALEGSVFEVVETLGLQKKRLAPQCEFSIPIRHALIRRLPPAAPQAPMAGIQRVLSHPQALGQCRETLHRYLGPAVECIPVASTAQAVQALAEGRYREGLDGEDPVAAIANLAASQRWGLPVVWDDLSDAPNNETRFLLVAAGGSQSGQVPSHWSGRPQKTSFCLGLADRPGALIDVLVIFKAFDLSLTKIESRPSRRQLGEYWFHLDVEGDVTTPAYQVLRRQLRKLTTQLHVLGPFAVFGQLR
jgi:prephenate dehydratase